MESIEKDLVETKGSGSLGEVVSNFPEIVNKIKDIFTPTTPPKEKPERDSSPRSTPPDRREPASRREPKKNRSSGKK